MFSSQNTISAPCEMELSSPLGDLDLAGSDEEKRRKDKKFILEYYEVRESHMAMRWDLF